MSAIKTNRKRLTIVDAPKHRVSGDRLVLHYRIKELGKWITAAQVNGLRRRGIKVEYGK
jgi:hypothetical protein